MELEGASRTPLGLVQWKRASCRVEAGTSGFLSISDFDGRVPAELEQESQASSCVEESSSACLSSCSRGDRPLAELYLEPAGFPGQCTGVSVSLRVVTSSTGLQLKKCPGIGFLSRADREIGVFRNVAPPTRLHLQFLCETGLILGAPGRSGSHSRQSRGIDPPVEIRRGQGAQRKCCWESSVFFSNETGISGKFLGRIKGVKYHFERQNGT